MKILHVFIFCLFFYPIFSQIPIDIKEQAGYERVNEAVSLGIPLEQGSYFEGQAFSLLQSNESVPAQFRPMAFWQDGSIRWLACDFQASVNANSTQRYELHPISSTFASPLTFSDNTNEIQVNTGVIQFHINKNSFSLFDEVWLDKNEDGTYSNNEKIVDANTSSGPYTRQNNTIYRSTSTIPDEVIIEEAGPMKITIKVSGHHFNNGNSLLKYETRITAFANQPYVKVRHTYANDQGMPSLSNPADPTFGVSLEEMGIQLHLQLEGTKTLIFGGDDNLPIQVNIPSNSSSSLQQLDRPTVNQAFQYDIRTGNNLTNSGNRSEGWVFFADDQHGIGVSSKYFWEKYPKGIQATDDGALRLQAISDNSFLYAGMGSSEEYLFWFAASNELTAISDPLLAMNKHPLHPHCLPEQYMETKAFYELSNCYEDQFSNLHSYIETVSENHLLNRELLDLYGNFNFGDVPSDQFALNPNRMESTWGNNYYDCALTAARRFVQTGNEAYFQILEPMVWHWMETDCWNTGDEDWLNGYCGAYSINHRAQSNFNHHYGEGAFYYYYLTNDPRALEVGLRAANAIVYQQVWGNENVGCRGAYQRGSVCLEAYKATGNPLYLNHARELIDAIMNTQNQFGMIGGSMNNGNDIVGEQSFMMGLFSDLVWKYLQEAFDPTLADQLTDLAQFVHDYARVSEGSENYYNFWQAPTQNSTTPFLTGSSDDYVYWNGKGLIAGLYAYAYDVSGEERFRTMAENLMNDMWETNFNSAFGWEFWGKASSQAMKNTLHAASILCEEAPISNTEIKETERFKFFPNPVRVGENIQFQFPYTGDFAIQLFHANGELLKTHQVRGQNHFQLYTPTIPTGMYIVNIKSENWQNTQRIVILDE